MSLENPQKNNTGEGPKMSKRDFGKMIVGAIATYGARSVVESGFAEIVDSATQPEGTDDIPSPDGLARIFDTLLKEVTKMTGVEGFRERRTCVTENGVLYLREIEFPITNGTAELGYMLKGSHPFGRSLATKICITFFDEGGMPEGGTDVATFSEGRWTTRDIEIPK